MLQVTQYIYRAFHLDNPYDYMFIVEDLLTLESTVQHAAVEYYSNSRQPIHMYKYRTPFRFKG